MAWDGWYEFGGTEIINVDRTEAYAKHANMGWFKPVHENGSLAALLGEPEYASPLQDDAPWTDPDAPESYRFYGAYPLEITGVEDSTWTAPVTESTGDGGVVGRARRATRTMVFSLALLGADECAVDYGFRWLKNAMVAGPCGDDTQDCNTGSNLCFLACPPALDWNVPAPPPPAPPVLTIKRTNKITNPSFETGINGWSAIGSGGAVATTTSAALRGKQCMQVYQADVTGAGMNLTTPVDAVPNDVWTGSLSIRLVTGEPTNTVNVRLRAQPGNVVVTNQVVTLTSAWQRIAVTGTMPSGTTGVDVAVARSIAGVHRYWVDAVMLEQGAAIGAYFDGDTPDGPDGKYDWTGPRGASESVLSTVAAASVPEQSSLDDCWDKLLWSLHSATTTVGPLVTGKRTMGNGGCAWTVTVTVTAGNPVLFSDERPLIVGFGDPKVQVPYVGGVVPPGGSFDADGFVQTEVKCPVPTYQPVMDPLCPLVIPPPAVPAIPLSCFTFPVNYTRRQFVIPPDKVPLWSKVVPSFAIHAKKEVRSLRLRFYADPQGDGSTVDDPCVFCGDIVFSYIPAGETMIFDGADQIVYVQSPTKGKRRADSLVFGSDGKPFDWPELTCGFGYVVTLDLPQTATLPVVDMSLYAKAV